MRTIYSSNSQPFPWGRSWLRRQMAGIRPRSTPPQTNNFRGNVPLVMLGSHLLLSAHGNEASARNAGGLPSRRDCSSISTQTSQPKRTDGIRHPSSTALTRGMTGSAPKVISGGLRWRLEAVAGCVRIAGIQRPDVKVWQMSIPISPARLTDGIRLQLRPSRARGLRGAARMVTHGRQLWGVAPTARDAANAFTLFQRRRVLRQ